MSRESKIESSIPVQSRIDIVDLASMHVFWESEGCRIRSMSQLVSWTVAAMVDVLKANGKRDERVGSVGEAHKYLLMQGLYQPGMMKRGREKINTALRMETLRGKGIDPRDYIPRQYNTLHNKKSVEVFEGEVVVEEERSQRIADAVDRGLEELKEKRKEEMERLTKKMKEEDLVIEEEMKDKIV